MLRLLIIFIMTLTFSSLGFVSFVNGEIEDVKIISEKIHEPNSHWKIYDTNDPLVWEDFIGPIPENPQNDAFTVSYIQYDYKTRIVEDENCAFQMLPNSGKVYAYMSKNMSWSIPEKQTKSLLDHEQGHFDIAKIYASRLENKFKKLEANRTYCDPSDSKSKESIAAIRFNSLMGEITNQIFTMRNFTDHYYDLETKNGTLSYQQERWDKILSLMLMNPDIDLYEARSFYPTPTQIIIDESKGNCPFFSFDDSCNVTNTTWLIIEILTGFIIGGILSVVFYKMEKRDRADIDAIIEYLGDKEEKRLDFAKTRICNELDHLELKLKQAHTTIHTYEETLEEKDLDEDEIVAGQWVDVQNLEVDINSLTKNLQFLSTISNGVLDFEYVEEIQDLIVLVQNRKLIWRREDSEGKEISSVIHDVQFDDVFDKINSIKKSLSCKKT